MSKKTFTETKFFKTLSTNPVDYFITKAALNRESKEVLKQAQKKKEKLLKEGFIGDPNNYYDVVRYEQAIDSEPIESYQDDDGVWTHIWPDGNKVSVKVTLSGLYLNDEQKYKESKVKTYKK
ncbi:MAG: hypothetical protein IKG58_04265 [Bacilli bacterium]|nr:hypothetical protein [Bacilli bacterium]